LLEEEDERVYADFTEGLRENFPASAAVFMVRDRRNWTPAAADRTFKQKFGEHIPLIRRQDFAGLSAHASLAGK
jgi:hypothetical protein